MSTGQKPMGNREQLGLGILVLVLVCLVVNSWGEHGITAWFPVLGIAAMIVALLIGARVRVGKDGVELDTRRRDGATEELQKAVNSRREGTIAGPKAVALLDGLDFIRFRDILWVDDHPENNIHEMRMLLHLGFRVTTATSTEAAELYLRSVPFDLVITDLGRGVDPEAGVKLVGLVKGLPGRRVPPVVVYTFGRDARSEVAKARGAAAISTMPDELLEAVLGLSSR